MDFPKKQQQCLIPRYLLQYLTSLEYHHTDPTAPWGGGGGGGSYTAGDGIDITNDVISVDDTVALKTDLLDYVTSTALATELLDYAELSDLATVATSGSYNDLLNKPTIPTKTSDLTNDSGYVTTQELLANYVTLNGTQTISGSKTFTGLTTFKGTYYNVFFGQSSGFSVVDKNNPVQEQMSIYPGFISSYRDTGNTSLDGRFHLGNHEFNAYNSDTEYKIKLVSKGGATTYGEYTFKNKTGDVAITSEIPDAVSGTNDGTNWTSLTIGNTTYNIPSGGGASYSAGTGIDITNNTISIDNTVATQSWVTNQGYVTSTDLASELLDYAELSDLATVATTGDYDDLINKPSLATVATTGNYNDLTNKPTIPTVPTNVSAFTNDAGYITSSALTNYVTTNTNQDIIGKKTFKTNPIDVVGTNKGIQLHSGNNNSTNAKLGFTLYNSTAGSSSYEVGFLEANTYSATQNGHSTLLGYYNPAITTNYSDWNLGFAYNGFNTTKGGITAYKLVIPNQYNLNDYNTIRYIPIDFTDGTNTVRSDATGTVNISSLLPTVPTNVSSFTNDAGYITGITSSDVTTALGYTPGTSNFSGSYNDLTNKPSIPDAVSGTNDGTNWTSLTIGSDTYGIPSGGGSAGPTVTRYTNTNSYMGGLWSGYATYTIYNGRMGQDEFNLINANPGDILIFDITLRYDANGTRYQRQLIKVVVPTKSTNTSYSGTHYDVAVSFEPFRIWATNLADNFIIIRLENITNVSSNYVSMGELIVPGYLGSSGTGAIIFNAITHIAY